MPERRNDNDALWIYFASNPGMDLKHNPIGVEPPFLVESVGVDGRYLGAIRPFPGFADSTIHGIPKPSGATTVTSITNLEYAKYVSIQKGQTGHTLKGIAYVAQNDGADNKAVYFAYRDSSDGSTDVVELEDFADWADFNISTLIDYEITSMGRYIYFAASASTTSSIATVTGKEPPYNKAYFWDFKVNTWDTFVVGFAQRFMSILPERILGVAINQNGEAPQADSTSAYQTVQDATGSYQLPVGNYTFGVMLVSRKHNLRSKLRMQMKNPVGSPASLKWRIFRTALPESDRQIFNSIGANPCIAHSWGMSHWDGMKLYRTPVDDLSDLVGASAILYVPTNPMYVQEAYLERYWDGALPDDEQFDVFFGTDAGDETYMQDGAIVQQEQYDEVLDDFGPAPRLKRLVAYDGMLVGITDVREPSSPTANWAENERIPESIVWSIVTRNPPEPENFPASQIYTPDDSSEAFLGLEPAGDYLFGVTNAAVYRMVRSGAQLSINKLQYRMGGVSRYGQIGIGNSLFVLTRSGVKEVDGNSGQVRSVSALDRLIFDDGGWASSLSTVHIGYDAFLGALILLNTTTKEVVLLWESTGAITMVENCPWTFLTSGPDVRTNGPQRAYFVDANAAVHCIDADRAMGKRSMCGTDADETVNGIFTSGVDQTTMVDSEATFPANVVGFQVHILSGDREGDIGTVTVRDSDTQLTVTGLGGAPAGADRYSVAPIITRLVFPQVGGDGGVDPFVAKIGTGISVALSDLGGETGFSDPNAKVITGYKRGGSTLASSEIDVGSVPDQCVSYVNFRDTRLHPFVEFRGGNMDFQLQAIRVKGQLTGSEAQSRQT